MEVCKKRVFTICYSPCLDLYDAYTRDQGQEVECQGQPCNYVTNDFRGHKFKSLMFFFFLFILMIHIHVTDINDSLDQTCGL